jgi:hypothetical protein
MPGKRLIINTQFNITLEIAVGYMKKTAQYLLDQTAPAAIDQWWEEARVRRPLSSEDNPVLAIECRASYPKDLGHLMMVQVLWVPNTDALRLQANKWKVERMIRFGDGIAGVDGGNLSPTREAQDVNERPHRLFPFFSHAAAYYKDTRGIPATRTLRHKDYASAASKHSAIHFDCVLVAKVLGKAAEFAVIDSFLWGMDLYKEAMLIRRDGMSALARGVLANEYPDCTFVTLGNGEQNRIDTTYTPFDTKTTVTKSKAKAQYWD